MMASSSSSSSSSIVDARTVEALNSATATAHAASASSTQRRNAATVSKGPLAFNRVAAEHTSRMMQYTYARAHASASKFAIALTAPKTHEKPVIAKSHKAAFFDLDGTIANSNVVAQYVVAKCDQMTTFWKFLWLPLYALKCAFYLVVDWLRCVLYKSFSPIARFQQLIASPFN